MHHVHARLVLSGLGSVASSYLLDRDQHVIGRSLGCDIPLCIGRSHAIAQSSQSSSLN
jgi:hypothetical protein